MNIDNKREEDQNPEGNETRMVDAKSLLMKLLDELKGITAATAEAMDAEVENGERSADAVIAITNATEETRKDAELTAGKLTKERASLKTKLRKLGKQEVAKRSEIAKAEESVRSLEVEIAKIAEAKAKEAAASKVVIGRTGAEVKASRREELRAMVEKHRQGGDTFELSNTLLEEIRSEGGLSSLIQAAEQGDTSTVGGATRAVFNVRGRTFSIHPAFIPIGKAQVDEVRALSIFGNANSKDGQSQNTSALLPFLLPDDGLSRLPVTATSSTDGRQSIPYYDPQPTRQTIYSEAGQSITGATSASVKNIELQPRRIGNVLQYRKAAGHTIVGLGASIQRELERLVRVSASNVILHAPSGAEASGQRVGILHRAGTNVFPIAGATGGAITSTIVQRMQAATLAAHGNKSTCAFLTNPNVVGELQIQSRTLESGGGNLITQMSKDMDQYLLGDQLVNSSLVPSNLVKGGSGTTLSALIHGDWEKLHVHQFGGIDVTVDPYTQKLPGAVEVLVELYIDADTPYPQLFSVTREIKTT